MEKFEQNLGIPEQKYQKNRIQLEKDGDITDIVEMVPSVMKSETPLMIMPGWTGTTETYEPNMKMIAEEGRRVMMANSEYGEDISPKNFLDEEKAQKYSVSSLRKVAVYIDMLEKMGVEKTDVIGYSEGGMNAIIAATLYPEKFKNIILVDPSGIIGEGSAVTLPINFSKEVVSGALEWVRTKEGRKMMLDIFKGVAGTVLKHPVLAYRQLLGNSSAELVEEMKELRSKGIGISVIHGVDDKLFPMKEMQKYADADAIDGFYSVKGSHPDFLFKSEAFTKASEAALSALEKKQENISK
jgi:pimeloyl-ACP methyl ester carboxylesterase